MQRNKLAKLQATLVGNLDSPTDLLTGVKCRATSVAKKLRVKGKMSRAAKKEAKELRTEVFFEAFWQDSGVVGIRKVLTKVVNKGLGFVKQQIQNKAIFSMNKKNQDYIFGFIRYLR